MSEREELERAIVALEAQRTTLGDVAVDAAIAGLRQKLVVLEQAEHGVSPTQEGERKFVTVMFADISGFTAMSERMDPERSRDLINACFEALVPVVNGYGGTVCRFLGDAILALFGAPVAHENDPERALRAALEMMDVLVAFNAEHGADLGMHIGINTGLAVVGALGTSEQHEYSAMGDAVIVAARLEDASERGEIFVGPDTYRATASLFEFEALAPIQLKGKSEPMPVYRLLDAKPEPGRVRGLEARGISSPLVGRDAEVAAFEGCIERLVAGQGGILFITGEAGVGKSRLVAEIRDSVIGVDGRSTDLPIRWLEGRALSFGQTISYRPFHDILIQYASIVEDDSEGKAWHKLESRIGDLFAGDTPEVLPYLAVLLGLKVQDRYAERIRYLDSDAMGRQIFLASRYLFERLARVQPVVLVFEDLHWADESSVRLLEHLLPLVEQVPLLICGVGRPYRQAPVTRLWQTASQYFPRSCMEIHLLPLSQVDSTRLMGNLLEIENLSPRVQETIVRKAEGNPFFLEEIVRALIDAGAVVHDVPAGRWRAAAQIETVVIPDTIQGAVMARVDRLDEDVKDVLRTAAVIGRRFSYRLLRFVVGMEQRLDRHLAELQAVELICERQREPELEYTFKHALAQEVTYESILLQKRQALHARVGQAIEALFEDRLEEFYGLLAYHYARAEAWEKAQTYLLEAGDQAGRVAADAESLVHYRQAMAAYARAFGERWDPVQRAMLERKMGEAFFRRGEHQQAFGYLQRALGCLGSPLPASRWQVRLAISRGLLRQVVYRLFPNLFVGRVGDRLDPALEERLHTYVIVGWIDLLTDRERFLLDAVTLLNVSERSGSLPAVIKGSAALGTILDFVSMFELAEYYYRRAMALAAQVRDPTIVGYVLLPLGIHEALQGEWDAALEHLLQAADANWEVGDLRMWGMAVAQAAVVWRHKGDFFRALEQSREAARVGRDGADSQVLAWGLHGQTLMEWRVGELDTDGAIERMQKVVQLYRAIPDHMVAAFASGDLGRCYLRRGELGQAIAVLERNRRFIAEKGVRGYWATSNRGGLAEAYLLAAEQAGGAARRDWLRRAGRACGIALRHARADRSCLPEAMRLQGRYAWLQGRRRAARRWWQRSIGAAGALGMRYELGVTHLEVGRRLGDRAHLEQAEAVLAEIGAAWELARARELLR